MKEARAQIGLDGKLLDDHLAIKKYFKEHVGMDRYKLATRFFEMMVEIHVAVVEGDHKCAFGSIVTVYQFIEQYTVDQGDMYVAALATHMPDPDRYVAEPRDEEVPVMASAYQRDLDSLRKAREKRTKKK